MTGKHRRQQPTMMPPALLLGFAAIPAVLAVVTAQPAPTIAAAPAQVVEATPQPMAYTVVKPAAAVVKPQRVPPIIGAKGLTRKARELAAYIQKTYPQVKEIGGVRKCDVYAEHCRGIALDIIVGNNTALGDRIAHDLLGRDGIQYLIWEETFRKPNGVSRWMSDRGSVTANHYDHIHVRVVG